jgi:hypothetical protein
MPIPAHLQEIPGSAELHDWFGYWPGFHDAEIIGLHLNRKGSSLLRVYTWEMTKEVDEKGYFVLTKHVVVEFVIEGIRALTIDGFNQQNVLFGIDIQKAEQGFRVNLDASYGVEGSFEADHICFCLTPGTPSEFA